VNEPRWLVVRDRFSRVVEFRALPAYADLRAVVEAESERRRAGGWAVDGIPRNCAFFFCDRENERLCVSIECYEPGPVGSLRPSIRS